MKLIQLFLVAVTAYTFVVWLKVALDHGPPFEIAALAAAVALCVGVLHWTDR